MFYFLAKNSENQDLFFKIKSSTSLSKSSSERLSSEAALSIF